MAYIYKITNDINNKIYVGKTEFSIEKRFQEHCRDSRKERCEKRPLYKAMQKYGIEHFHIELLEETNNPEEREKYWINALHSYHYGYNATQGGDGKKFIDYDLVVKTFLFFWTIVDTAKNLNIDERYVATILKHQNITPPTSKETIRKKMGKSVNQYDLDGNYLNTYETLGDAVKATHPNLSTYSNGLKSSISDCCKGKRKTAFGYKWSFTK